MSKDWISYDSVAGGHDARVPLMFLGPARDLAVRMDLESARSMLDVGTGTGIVARQATCPIVVGADPSLEMLRRAVANGLPLATAAVAPGLPFADETFDRVTAGFVLSHVPSYSDALGDMVRVLRRGGRLGVTAWSSRDSEYREWWTASMERFVDVRALEAQALPWEEWLMSPQNVRAALSNAGLGGIAIDDIEYPMEMTVSSFLEMRETSVSARFLRSTDPAAWDRFRETIAAEFDRRFQSPVLLRYRALIATARR